MNEVKEIVKPVRMYGRGAVVALVAMMSGVALILVSMVGLAPAGAADTNLPAGEQSSAHKERVNPIAPADDDYVIPDCDVATEGIQCVEAISPDSGDVGETVTITGYDIGFGLATVKFGEVLGDNVTVSEDLGTVTVEVPAQAEDFAGGQTTIYFPWGSGGESGQNVVGSFTYPTPTPAPAPAPAPEPKPEQTIRDECWDGALLDYMRGHLSADQISATSVMDLSRGTVIAQYVGQPSPPELVEILGAENLCLQQNGLSTIPTRSLKSSPTTRASATTVSFAINGVPACTTRTTGVIASCKSKIKFKGRPTLSSTISGSIAGRPYTVTHTNRSAKKQAVIVTKASLTKNSGKNRTVKIAGVGTAKKTVQVLVKQGKKFKTVGKAKTNAKGVWKLSKKFKATTSKSSTTLVQVRLGKKQLSLRL